MMLALDTSHALWRWFLVSIALLCVPLVLISGCAHIDENRVRSPSSELQNKQVENDVEAEMVASVFSVLTVDQADSIYPREINPEASRAAGLSKSGELSEEYLAAKGEVYGFLLKHSTGFRLRNSEVDAPLTYADYYFLEALMRWRNLNSR